MGLFHYLWSRTAASNATADSNINWAEGMAPSAVNDSARAMMASLAGYRDDTAGAITTGGTSTAYTLTTYEVFDSLAHMDGQVVAFTPHATNGSAANITLNVDGLGAKSIQFSPGVELPAGTLIQGAPYTAIYNAGTGVFYLHNFFGNPYLIPIGGSIDFWGSTSPNSSFVLPYGQAISRTTYSTLFSLLGTTYGSGDGSTTFNIPDLRGRVVAGKDDMGGSAASRLSGTFITGPTTLGGSGGSESRTLVTSNLPPYTPAGTITNGSISISHNAAAFPNTTTGGGGFQAGGGSASISASQAASTFAGTAQGGTSAAFGILQPTIIANKLIRII